tara:strand:+ start:1986 stop:2210 length:225 start_codon:yes stop_codon:yes gene_type:complete
LSSSSTSFYKLAKLKYGDYSGENISWWGFIVIKIPHQVPTQNEIKQIKTLITFITRSFKELRNIKNNNNPSIDI